MATNPEAAIRQRKALFKTTRAQAQSKGGTPVWKERFRDRCLKRVSSRREQLIAKLRANPRDLTPLRTFAQDVYQSELENSRKLGLLAPTDDSAENSSFSFATDDTEMKSDSGDSVANASEAPSPQKHKSSFSALAPCPFPSDESKGPSQFSSTASPFSLPYSTASNSSDFDMKDSSLLQSGDDHAFLNGNPRTLFDSGGLSVFVSNDDELEILRMIEEEARMQILESDPDGELLRRFEMFEEGLLEDEINDYVASESVHTAEKVLCPLCEKSYLDQDGRFILCRCGFKLDVESLGLVSKQRLNDGLTLSNLRDRLASCLEHHGSQCSERPRFHIRNQFGITTLCVSCDTCQCNEIVL